MSPVACRTIIAQVWRSTWGETRFFFRPGLCRAAVATCCLSRYAKPHRVSGSPPPLSHTPGGGPPPRGGGAPPASGEPGTQSRCRGLPQGQRPLPPSLAENADAHRRQVDIVDLQACQLGHTQSCAAGQMQHRPIADAVTRGGIGRVKHGLQLILQQIGNEPLIRPLERDRQYAADLLERRGRWVLEEGEERFDGRKPHVARDGRVSAYIFEMLEEGANEAGVELLQRQCRRPDLQSFGGEREDSTGMGWAVCAI